MPVHVARITKLCAVCGVAIHRRPRQFTTATPTCSTACRDVQASRANRAIGNRWVSHDGHVLVSVGRDHPLADARGYAREHHLVAAEMLGRALLPDEYVAWLNGDRSDNRPENLVVLRRRRMA